MIFLALLDGLAYLSASATIMYRTVLRLCIWRPMKYSEKYYNAQDHWSSWAQSSAHLMIQMDGKWRALPSFHDSMASYSVKSWDYKNSIEMTLFFSINTAHEREDWWSRVNNLIFCNALKSLDEVKKPLLIWYIHGFHFNLFLHVIAPDWCSYALMQ